MSAIKRALRRLLQTESGASVHFHRGPQGQPVPCYDEACPNPHLDVS
jgi:hypothetical protein